MDVRLFSLPGRPGGEARFVIYRPLTGLAFVGNRALANAATRAAGHTPPAPLPPDVDAFFRDAGFYAPDPPAPPPAAAPFRPTTAVLLLTNRCQLRCTYCYAAAGARPAETLSPALGCAAIDAVVAAAQAAGRDRFELSLHGGGEPTLAWATLQACIAHARAQPLPAYISLTSNGVWSARRRAWLLDHVDAFSLSLDGRPATQDRRRPFAGGRGSSAIVLDTARAVDAAGKPYGIRMTATAPWDDIPDDVAYLVRHTACPSFQIEPAFNETRGGHNAGTAAEWQAFAAAFIAAFHVARGHGRRLIYSGARVDTVTTTFCQAPYQALIVNPGGRLVTCYEVADDHHGLAALSVIGQMAGGQAEIDDAARDRLHSLMARRRAVCGDCPCYWSCAGDCYARTFGPDGGASLVYGPRCDANRAITGQLLLAEIAAGGGIKRPGPDPANGVGGAPLSVSGTATGAPRPTRRQTAVCPSPSER